jgi:hypothetical protein
MAKPAKKPQMGSSTRKRRYPATRARTPIIRARIAVQIIWKVMRFSFNHD